MTEYGYFTSYARADNDRSTLTDVARDLGTEVRKKLGLDKDEGVAFFDEHDITTGDEWDETLRDAANRARVLVCMCSRTFLTRPHCAKEFEIFRRRLEADPEHAPVIVPIVWEPATLPAALSRYQVTDDRLPKKYQRTGLRGLRRLKSKRDKYLLAVDGLSALIAEKIRQPQLKPLDDVPSFAALPDGFHDPGQRSFGCAAIVLHPDGEGWRLDPFNDPVGLLLGRAAENAGLSLRLIARGVDVAAELPTDPQQEHLLVVTTDEHIGVDPWKGYATVVERVPGATWVVVHRSDLDPPARGVAVVIGDVAGFDKVVTTALGTWLGGLAAARAEQPETESAARRRGVDVTRRPSVAGPSGDER